MRRKLCREKISILPVKFQALKQRVTVDNLAPIVSLFVANSLNDDLRIAIMS